MSDGPGIPVSKYQPGLAAVDIGEDAIADIEE